VYVDARNIHSNFKLHFREELHRKKKVEVVRTQKATGQEIGGTLMPKSIKAVAERE
jgi:hypothetical protein